jgi:mannitol-1-phosphate 5-dehydrogenase
MSTPHCLVIGSGRIAGGFIAPLLRAADWQVTLACRNPSVLGAIKATGGLWLRMGGSPEESWIGGVDAVALTDGDLACLVARADLIAIAVGPTQLPEVGRLLGPLLRERRDVSAAPINLLTFENHRRAPELLAAGLLATSPQLAVEIGRWLGIGGAAVWRAVSHRVLADDGVHFQSDAVDESYVDAVSLVREVPPGDGAVPEMELVWSFDDRMVEKLWIFNAGHATAAYLGWQAGCVTLEAAMGLVEIRSAVASVVAEAQRAFDAHLACRPGSPPIPARGLKWILDRYADPALRDPVVRVAREPRRKLAAGDRLIGPACAALAGGFEPVALAAAAAAALAYGEPSDPQAADLQRELTLLGPAEVLAAVSTLEPREQLVRLICERYYEGAFSMVTR